jgi:HlyD family secretion protein
MKRIGVVIGVIIVIVGAAAGAYWVLGKGKAKVQYKTEAVQRGAISAQVIATGTVNPVTLVQVGSQVSGTIIKLMADFNSPVRQGQAIARIDPALFQAKVDQTEADLKNARTQLEREKTTLQDTLRTLKRYRSLLQDQLVAQFDLDQAQTKYDVSQAAVKSAQAQIETAQANLASARTNLNYTTIRSPVTGIVVARNVDVGQTVAASLQAPTLFVIAQDLKDMEVHTNVDEADIGRVKTGQEASFTVDAFPGEPFKAEVVQIRNAATTLQNVVTYDVVLRVKNPELKLKPGMTANVAVIIEEKEGVLKVPNAALRFKPSPAPAPGKQRKGPLVWMAGPENKAIPVPVKPGLTDGQATEITGSRLKEGDPVITEMVQDKNTKAGNNRARGPRL